MWKGRGDRLFVAAEDHVRAVANASASRQQLAEEGSKDASPEGSQDEADEPSGVCVP